MYDKRNGKTKVKPDLTMYKSAKRLEEFRENW